MGMSTALITGAVGGIGYELARQLAARGQTVIAVCRKPGVELPRLPVRVEADIDIATDAGCAALAMRMAGVPLDLVIHNAGVLSDDSPKRSTRKRSPKSVGSSKSTRWHRCD